MSPGKTSHSDYMSQKMGSSAGSSNIVECGKNPENLPRCQRKYDSVKEERDDARRWNSDVEEQLKKINERMDNFERESKEMKREIIHLKRAIAPLEIRSMMEKQFGLKDEQTKQTNEKNRRDHQIDDDAYGTLHGKLSYAVHNTLPKDNETVVLFDTSDLKPDQHHIIDVISKIYRLRIEK